MSFCLEEHFKSFTDNSRCRSFEDTNKKISNNGHALTMVLVYRGILWSTFEHTHVFPHQCYSIIAKKDCLQITSFWKKGKSTQSEVALKLYSVLSETDEHESGMFLLCWFYT